MKKFLKLCTVMLLLSLSAFGCSSGSDGGGATAGFAVETVAPEADATDVLVDQVISITYASDVDATSVTATTFYVKKVTDGSLVSGTASVSGKTVTFTRDSQAQYPFDLLLPGTEYAIVTAGITGTDGTILPSSEDSFTTTSYNRLSSSIASGSAASSYVIDVRKASDISDGIIKSSNIIDYDTIISGNLSALPTNLAQPLLFVSQSGKKSDIAASYAARGGYSVVKTLEGGMDDWVEGNYPMAHLYFTQMQHDADGPLMINMGWDMVATNQATCEYKLLQDSKVIVDWTSTSEKASPE